MRRLLQSLRLAAAAALTLATGSGEAAQRATGAASRLPLRAQISTCRLEARPLAATAPVRRSSDGGPCHSPLLGVVLPQDIPADLLRARLETETVLAVEIAPTGAFTACRTVAASAAPSFDRIACDSIARRGRFRPVYIGPGQRAATVWEIRVRLVVTDQPPPIFASPAPSPDAAPFAPTPGRWPRLEWLSYFDAAALPRIQERFPAAAARDGTVSLDLLVTAANGVEGCTVGVGADDAALDAAACEVARTIALRYRNPCEDCRGAAFPLQVVWRRGGGSHVRYPLPAPSMAAIGFASPVKDPADTRAALVYRRDPQPLPFPVGRSDYRGIRDRTMTSTEFRGSLDIDASGRMTVCRALGSTGNPAIERRTCELFVRRGRAVPRTDVFGDPLASRGVSVRLRLDDIR